MFKNCFRFLPLLVIIKFFYNISLAEFKASPVNLASVMSRTVLLLQPSPTLNSRTYSDYESVDDCLEGICKMYEERLKRLHSTSSCITYDVSELFDFIDQLTDISCLVYQADLNTYARHTREWIKGNLFNLLRRQANA